MINAVGRDIPEEILKQTGKEVFQGNYYKDGKPFHKAGPMVTPVMNHDHDKMVKDIHEALVKCNAHDGMTVSFHHHFRDGDLVVCMVMKEIQKMGLKDITISAMLPVYKRLYMRRETLLLICVTAMGVMNLMPWGGPTMRAASVVGIEPNDLWFRLMPMQLVGLVLAVGTALFWGVQEKKRIAKLGDAACEDADRYDDSESTEKDASLARPQNFVFNLVLTLVVIIVLVLDILPTYVVFMIACTLGLFVNYHGKKLQSQIIKSHAAAGLTMASTILCAGVFLGVLQQSGIMEEMAVVMAGFIPPAMGRFLPVIIGVFSVPLALLFDTDSYFYGLLPVLMSVGTQFGVDPVHIAISMVVCRNCATFISPVAPATYLGIGLAGVEIKDHIKYCFGWQWGVSILCLVAGLLLGIIRF